MSLLNANGETRYSDKMQNACFSYATGAINVPDIAGTFHEAYEYSLTHQKHPWLEYGDNYRALLTMGIVEFITKPTLALVTTDKTVALPVRRRDHEDAWELITDALISIRPSGQHNRTIRYDLAERIKQIVQYEFKCDPLRCGDTTVRNMHLAERLAFSDNTLLCVLFDVSKFSDIDIRTMCTNLYLNYGKPYVRKL